MTKVGLLRIPLAPFQPPRGLKVNPDVRNACETYTDFVHPPLVSILRNETTNSTRLQGSRLVNTWISSPNDYHTQIGNGWFLAKRPEQAGQGPQDGEGDFAWYLQGNRVAYGRK